MHFVCRTCSAVQRVVPERESRCTSCGTRLLPRETAASEHVWYTRGSAGQAGPFDAAELTRKLDRGELTWTDEVWREGLRTWRPARKDDVLVVELASARGLDTSTTRVDSLTRLLSSTREPMTLAIEDLPHQDDTLVDAAPAGLAGSWPAPPLLTRRTRPSRTRALARVLKLATLALVAFVCGGMLVSLVGRLGELVRSADASPPVLPVPSSSLVGTAPVELARPLSGELVTRTLPALDEIRAELRRLAPSAQRCVRDLRAGLELELTVAGETGRPSRVDVRTPRLTPGMIECSKAALEQLRVAPFTAPELNYHHRYAW